MSVSVLRSVQQVARRNFGVFAPAMQASDPIQSLFVEKVQEYSKKSKAAGGAFVDSTKASEADLTRELEKVAKQYGGGAGVDMTSFPVITFADPVIDPINIATA